MGRTRVKESNKLRIKHATGRMPVLSPGDTFRGSVCRELPLVRPKATLTVTLYGRVAAFKTSININNNDTSSEVTHSLIFPVVDEEKNCVTLFHKIPVHAIGDGPTLWDFAIDIPTHVDPKKFPRIHQSFADKTYLPADASTAATHRLPSTFDLCYDRYPEGFVEYYLKAHLINVRGGYLEEEEATFPFTVLDLPTTPPIADFKLTRRFRPAKVSSFRLLPDMDGASLSFTQRRQQLFSSDKVPQVGGNMEIDLPGVVQLDNPTSIPVKIRFVPEVETASGGMREIPAKFELLGFDVTITSFTGFFTGREQESRVEESTTLQIWPASRSIKAAGVDGAPIFIPYGHECPAIDVGERTMLVMRRLQRVTDVNKKAPLRGDFVTYNIKHWHKMKFDFTFGIGGEKIKIGYTERVTLLPPSDDRVTSSGSSSQTEQTVMEEPPRLQPPRSESWIRPPDEVDAPPSFEDVQREDMLRRGQRTEAASAGG